jgi:hypothetical protein
MRKLLIDSALLSLYSNNNWEFHGEDYSGLVWRDTTPKPTEQELLNELNRLQNELDANAYKELRAAEYPPITEQLDKIFHDGIDEWKKEIQAVKDKYPKGE